MDNIAKTKPGILNGLETVKITGKDGILYEVSVSELAGVNSKMIIALSDYDTDLETGTKDSLKLIWELFLKDLAITVDTAPTGDDIIVDIHCDGVTIFSTPLQIDIGDISSKDSVVPYVLVKNRIPIDSKLEFIIDQIGSANAGTGLKLHIDGSTL